MPSNITANPGGKYVCNGIDRRIPLHLTSIARYHQTYGFSCLFVKRWEGAILICCKHSRFLSNAGKGVSRTVVCRCLGPTGVGSPLFDASQACIKAAPTHLSTVHHTMAATRCPNYPKATGNCAGRAYSDRPAASTTLCFNYPKTYGYCACSGCNVAFPSYGANYIRTNDSHAAASAALSAEDQ